MRTLLFAGFGGAGTTTLAAAAALGSARAGRSTVLLSRGQPAVSGLDGVDGLRVVVVDPRAAVEEVWGALLRPLRAALPQLELAPAGAVLPVPGAGLLALLAELSRAQADAIVVDAGSLTDVVELVGLPAALTWWLDQLLPARLRALGALRTAAVAAGAMAPGPVDAALGVAPAVQDLLARTSLTDPAHTSPVLVAVPRRGAVAALRTTTTALAVHGQRPAGVLARVFPEEAGGEWWRARRAEQDDALRAFADVAEVWPVPEAAASPGTADQLAGLLAGADPAGWPTVAGHRPAGPERADDGWRLVLPLPFAAHGGIEAARHGDALLVTAAGARRSLRLDSLLRRCRVAGARLAEAGTAQASLELSFVPDPQLWPADLLAAEGSAR